MITPVRVLCAIGSMDGGGSQRQMLAVLQGLDRSQFAPRMYLIDRRGELLEQIPGDVPVFCFRDRHPNPTWYYPGRIHQLQVRDLANVLRTESIEVLYDRTSFMTRITGPATRRCRVPRISVIVSSPHQDLQTTAGRFRGIKRRMLARAYRGAARVLAVSEGVRQDAIRFYGLPPDQVLTAYNTVDVELIARLSAESSVPLEADRFHIVAAGRLEQEKGLHYLLQAVHQLVHVGGRTDLLLHLLGDGRQRGELDAFVHANQLAAHVRFHGFLANPYPLIRQANLYCLPSLYEGMPNVLLEAMVCGTPVLATDCASGPRELLAGGQFGRLIPPANSAALAEALADAMTNYRQWQQLTTPARDHVTRNFSRAVGLGRLQQLFFEVTGRQ